MSDSLGALLSTDPAAEPDVSGWETELAFRLAD